MKSAKDIEAFVYERVDFQQGFALGTMDLSVAIAKIQNAAAKFIAFAQNHNLSSDEMRLANAIFANGTPDYFLLTTHCDEHMQEVVDRAKLFISRCDDLG